MKVALRKTSSTSRTPRLFNSKRGWETIEGKEYFFRSAWEKKYARYLQFLKNHNQIKEWFYEPKRFRFEGIKSGTTSYLPDFQIIRHDGSCYWVEVKGYLDAKSKTQIKRFKKYFPQEELYIVDKKWFNKQKILLNL